MAKEQNVWYISGNNDGSENSQFIPNNSPSRAVRLTLIFVVVDLIVAVAVNGGAIGSLLT